MIKVSGVWFVGVRMLCGVEQMVQDLSDGSNDDEGSGAGCCWCCCVKPGTVFQCRVLHRSCFILFACILLLCQCQGCEFPGAAVLSLLIVFDNNWC